MALYDKPNHGAQVPPMCPKCGSHRTQVVGRSNDSKTLTLRCGECAERSVVVITEETSVGPREGGA